MWNLGGSELLRVEPLGNLIFLEWNLDVGTSFQILGSCTKPPRSFIGRTPSFSKLLGENLALQTTAASSRDRVPEFQGSEVLRDQSSKGSTAPRIPGF